jgi:FkbH-like protein
MIAEVKFFSSIYLDRIAQLINKTNQFNLTTKRYTVGEIVKISSSDKHVKIYGKLKDKYGDNGLISVIIGTLDKEFCHIDLWIMSCRVFKRDMELVMLDELVRRCLELNVTEIIGYYYISPKNNIVKDLYKKLGFTLEYLGDNPVWRLNIINYKMKNTLISVQV